MNWSAVTVLHSLKWASRTMDCPVHFLELSCIDFYFWWGFNSRQCETPVSSDMDITAVWQSMRCGYILPTVNGRKFEIHLWNRNLYLPAAILLNFAQSSVLYTALCIELLMSLFYCTRVVVFLVMLSYVNRCSLHPLKVCT